MINSQEIYGLRIEKIEPANEQLNVSTLSQIKITFNSDINISTITGNFIVLKDKNLKYTNIESLKNIDDFNVVNGKVSYGNRVMTFTPENPFDKSSKYIICFKANGIKDILNNTFLIDYAFVFYTEEFETIKQVNILTPHYGYISNKMPILEFEKIENANAYTVQIARTNTFETLVLEDTIVAEDDEIVQYDTKLNTVKEGEYYIRVKALNGLWSNIVQIYIKNTPDYPITIENVKEDIENIDIMQIPTSEYLELLEVFPKENSSNTEVKVKSIYAKVKGLVNLNDINFNNTYVKGYLVDEDDAETLKEHGILKGNWNVVYDEGEDITYIIFTPQL